MFITTDNITTPQNTSVTGAANPLYPVEFLISNDFNLEYTCASSLDDFEITISEPVTYIAIAGSDYFGKVDSITISGGEGQSSNLVGAGEREMEVYFDGYATKVVMTFDDGQQRYRVNDPALVAFLNSNAGQVVDYAISNRFDSNPFDPGPYPDALQMTVGSDGSSVGYSTGFGSLSDDSYGYFDVSIVNFSGLVSTGDFALSASDGSKWAYNLLDADGNNLVISLSTDQAYTPDDNATIVHIFDKPTTNAKITFNRGGNTRPITVSYFAAGNSWEVPNSGEMAGYARPWSNPQLRNRTQVNKGMPTSAIVETTILNGKLKVDNMLTSDVVDIWVPFQSFAIREGFFIVEDETKPDYGYYCYNAKTEAVKAHSQTRTLQNAGIGFSCWTGRS